MSARVQAIQAVSDAALSELNVDALLRELLGRVPRALGADTAVVLLVDEAGEQLVARGAVGLEEEVAQEIRVAVGAGFAGRVAATRAPVIIENLECADVVNPLLRARGVRWLLGVPLIVDGKLLGVLHVGTLQTRSFNMADAELLQLAGDRVALALDRARLFDAAQEAVRLRNDFLSAISHDLGNEITAIRMLSHIAQSALPTDVASRPAGGQALGAHAVVGASEVAAGLSGQVAAIEATARRAWGLIEELLDLARLQVGRDLHLNWQRMDLVELLQEAVHAQQSATTKHTFRLQLDAPVLNGEWDPARIERVITNLLSNAVKYSPGGGEIVVHAGRTELADPPGQWAVLEVSDQGIGIPATDLPHVFERFRRGSNVGTFPHTGIGLAGAKAIVEHHGGGLTIESREGAGTKVTIRLPIEDESA